MPYLAPRLLARTRRVADALRNSWQHDAPIAAASSALVPLLAHDIQGIYTLDRHGEVSDVQLGGDKPFREIARRTHREGHHRFAKQGRDPLAAKAVTSEQLWKGASAARLRYSALLGEYGLDAAYTARVTFQHELRTYAWIGFIRGPDAGPFQEDEVAALDYLIPLLQPLALGQHVFASGYLRGLNIQAMLDAFSSPSFLTDESGHIVVANAAARLNCRRTPSWLPSAVSGASVVGVTVSPIMIDGCKHFLVVSREAPPQLARAQMEETLAELPNSLETVARLILEGLSDKEIAARTGRSYNTVRTYVRRLYTRYEVHNRVSLARALRGER